MLAICTSHQAALLRDSIYDLAEAGMTADELVEWMLEGHGEEWRAVPRRSGAGLWAWIIPPLALLVGVAIMVMWLRASRAPEDALALEPSTLSNDDRDRLAVALRNWDEVEDEVV